MKDTEAFKELVIKAIEMFNDTGAIIEHDSDRGQEICIRFTRPFHIKDIELATEYVKEVYGYTEIICDSAIHKEGSDSQIVMWFE